MGGDNEQNGWELRIKGMRKWTSEEILPFTSPQWTERNILEVNRLALEDVGVERIAKSVRKSKQAVVNKVVRLREKSPSLFAHTVSDHTRSNKNQATDSNNNDQQQTDDAETTGHLWERLIEGMRLWDEKELQTLESRSWSVDD